MIANVSALNLTFEEYDLAKQGKHPKFEVNKVVIDLLNRTEQIRYIVMRRSEILARQGKNKILDSLVMISPENHGVKEKDLDEAIFKDYTHDKQESVSDINASSTESESAGAPIVQQEN